MTPRSAALHHLDDHNVKMHAFIRENRDDPRPESGRPPFHRNLGPRPFAEADS